MDKVLNACSGSGSGGDDGGAISLYHLINLNLLPIPEEMTSTTVAAEREKSRDGCWRLYPFPRPDVIRNYVKGLKKFLRQSKARRIILEALKLVIRPYLNAERINLAVSMILKSDYKKLAKPQHNIFQKHSVARRCVQ
ncbi:hypothetical protein Trydic_g19565 [Trypoxylus dichotomus]